MTPIDQAFISGTTLAQFVSAAYACPEGYKMVFDLYGQRQSARELTDRPESSEKVAVVVLGAAPRGSADIPTGFTRLGFLSICQAPVHKLSFADMQRMKQQLITADHHASEVLFHFTKEKSSDGIVRVIYTIHEFEGKSADTPRALKLSVDNLVDSLQGFTKISNAFLRSTLSNNIVKSESILPVSEIEALLAEMEVEQLDAFAKEKAELVRKIVELTQTLSTKLPSSS